MSKKSDWLSGSYARVHANAIRDLSHLEFRVYCALALYANTDGVCFPSQETLTETLGLKPASVRNVRKALKSLMDQGWVVRIERGNNHKQQANKYLLKYAGYTGSNETSVQGQMEHCTGSNGTPVQGHIAPPNRSMTNQEQTIKQGNTNLYLFSGDSSERNLKEICQSCGAPSGIPCNQQICESNRGLSQADEDLLARLKGAAR